jgi:hypothetical protein
MDDRKIEISRRELREDFEQTFALSSLDFKRDAANEYVDYPTIRAFQAWVCSYETYAGYVRP